MWWVKDAGCAVQSAEAAWNLSLVFLITISASVLNLKDRISLLARIPLSGICAKEGGIWWNNYSFLQGQKYFQWVRVKIIEGSGTRGVLHSASKGITEASMLSLSGKGFEDLMVVNLARYKPTGEYVTVRRVNLEACTNEMVTFLQVTTIIMQA